MSLAYDLQDAAALNDLSGSEFNRVEVTKDSKLLFQNFGRDKRLRFHVFLPCPDPIRVFMIDEFKHLESLCDVTALVLKDEGSGSYDFPALGIIHTAPELLPLQLTPAGRSQDHLLSASGQVGAPSSGSSGCARSPAGPGSGRNNLPGSVTRYDRVAGIRINGRAAVSKTSSTNRSRSIRADFVWLESSGSTAHKGFIVAGSQSTKFTCLRSILLRAPRFSLGHFTKNRSPN